MSRCNNIQNCTCSEGNLSDNNDKLKRELADFIDILRDRVSDIAFDNNYQNLLNVIASVKSDLDKAIEEAYEDIQNTRAGSTELRPIEPFIGMQFFDTDLGKPILWNGTAWVDSLGETV